MTTARIAPRRFHLVDVFTDTPLCGNPLAVVHDADGLSDARMAACARWFNLSETAFLLSPTEPAADYRVRIFTPDRELPFAGHPTLGSCHAWLASGGLPRSVQAAGRAVVGDALAATAAAGTNARAGGDAAIAPCEIVQQCGVGLVRLRRDGAGRLAFAAPPLRRSGPVDAATLAHAAAALCIEPADIVASNWVDNGPGWVAVMLGSRDAVLALRPDFVRMRGLQLGVVGAWPSGAFGTAVVAAAEARPVGASDMADSATPQAARSADDAADALSPPAFEVRAFVPELGVPEDPVTGSLNAGIAQWLIGAGLAPDRYVASQGTALGRRGRVHVDRAADGTVWVGGGCVVCIDGPLNV